MATRFAKFTVIAMLAWSSWLSEASLDESREASACVADKECHGKVGSKSGDAMLQMKSHLQGERSDNRSVEWVGYGNCVEYRVDSRLGWGSDGKEYIRPPRTVKYGPTSKRECEETARTYSDALGFSLFLDYWDYDQASDCSIFLPECEDDLYYRSCGVCVFVEGSNCWKGPFEDDNDYYYSYYYNVVPGAFDHPQASGPYKIDDAIQYYWQYYYTTCFKFQE